MFNINTPSIYSLLIAREGAITDQTPVCTDYSLDNPDTLTKYKKASEISQKVLESVKGWCVEGAKILTVCEKGDQLLNDEVAKVYKGKNVSKGMSLREVSSIVVSCQPVGCLLRDV